MKNCTLLDFSILRRASCWDKIQLTPYTQSIKRVSKLIQNTNVISGLCDVIRRYIKNGEKKLVNVR